MHSTLGFSKWRYQLKSNIVKVNAYVDEVDSKTWEGKHSFLKMIIILYAHYEVSGNTTLNLFEFRYNSMSFYLKIGIL